MRSLVSAILRVTAVLAIVSVQANSVNTTPRFCTKGTMTRAAESTISKITALLRSPPLARSRDTYQSLTREITMPKTAAAV
jgi:hypothetical protein